LAAPQVGGYLGYSSRDAYVVAKAARDRSCRAQWNARSGSSTSDVSQEGATAFVSKGLRCCSTECGRKFREREEIAATIAEVGAEPIGFAKRKCECCGGDIPRYTGVGKARKETRKDARYCSKKCAQKAWRLSPFRSRIYSDDSTMLTNSVSIKIQISSVA
jgi:hypothetical protein